jgi:transposase
VFLDESGFLLIPNVVRTWGPRGQTPVFRHVYKQDRISAISALALSAGRERLSLYARFRARNLNGLDVRDFVRSLLRHRRGPVVLLWDRGKIHRSGAVERLKARHPRLTVEEFPAYAPELNPAEFVWAKADRAQANRVAWDVEELRGQLWNATRRIRGSQRLLWSCIHASDLPWP